MKIGRRTPARLQVVSTPNACSIFPNAENRTHNKQDAATFRQGSAWPPPFFYLSANNQ